MTKMMGFVRTIIFCLLFLPIFSVPTNIVGSELVGIFPFSNQRPNQENNWLGFYIQARISSLLHINSDWNFHNLSTLRLWRYNSSGSQPVSQESTIFVTGSYQQVLSFGYITVLIQRIKPRKAKSKVFEVSYAEDTLEKKLDDLAVEIGRWIKPSFKAQNKVVFPEHNESGIKEIFNYRQMMFHPKEIPEIRQTLALQDLVTSNGPQGFIADLAEGMIVLTQDLPRIEQKSILSDVERLLRKTAQREIKNSRIHALLAETYYLKEEQSTWVEQTAKQAVALDSQNDLALLLLVLSSDATSDNGKDYLKDLRRVNPWMWTETKTPAARFQKGMLNAELLELSKDSM